MWPVVQASGVVEYLDASEFDALTGSAGTFHSDYADILSAGSLFMR